MPKEPEINVELSRLMMQMEYRQAIQKNWRRLCITIDGFRSRFKQWPQRVRIKAPCYNSLRNLFSADSFRKITAKVELIPFDRPLGPDNSAFVAEDDEGNRFSYGWDGFGHPAPDIDAQRWLGVGPDRLPE